MLKQKLMMKYKVKYLTLMAALPALLVAVSPMLGIDRSVASLSQFRNWGLANNVGDSHIHAVDAWKLEEGSRDIVVAVVDTGIDANHPDIKPNLWHDKATGIYGWDFVTNKPNPVDDHSHGTHVAGILGATLDAKAGISGVAHHVSIMAVKYYSEKNSGAENLRNSIRALNWAIDHGANIINYSGGGPEFSGEEYSALKRAHDKGILLVAAAGNERQNSDIPENFYYPCAYRLDNIICVAATNIHNEMLPSSNWGKVRVDVAAPGENILSTVPGGKDVNGNYVAKYAYMSGTSQATAFVTGEAALLLSKNRALKPDQIRDIVRSNVDRLPSLKDKVYSGGKVNAYMALASLERLKKTLPVQVARSESKLVVPAAKPSKLKRAAALHQEKSRATSGGA